MKVLEKIILIIYSILMLVVSIILCLLVFGWLDMNLMGNMVKQILTGATSSNIVLVISILFILLSIKCIFFGSTSKKEEKERQGVLLENENGKLMISKDTLENLVNSVAKEFENAQDIVTRVDLDRENNVRVYATLVVSSNAVIKDLSANLQEKVKEKIKAATDLEVKEVNIKVKNVAPKSEVQNV